MRAILRKSFGGPEVLTIAEHPAPKPRDGEVLIEVKASGLNHTERYMRSRNWPEAGPISGIECAGVVRTCPGNEFKTGQKVVALMGGMGRTLNGSYAALTCVPASNVIAVETEMRWD